MRCFITLFFFLYSSLLLAKPTAPEVVAGQAHFAEKGKSFQITASDRTIIQWQSFSIAKDELAQFLFPDAKGAVLNKITGGDISEILGTLKGNGKIYIVNPNGIIVGKDAVINVAEFIGSTNDLLNEDFLKNAALTFKGNKSGPLINYGKISAWDGDVYLIGNMVENAGQIEAKNGRVGLAAGREIVLKPSGDSRLYIRPDLSQDAEEVGIDQSGQILALQVELKAEGNPYAHSIRHSGKTDALKIVNKNGRILLDVSDGKAKIEGMLVASGGDVEIKGRGLEISGTIDVSSNEGGGMIAVDSARGESSYSWLTQEGHLKADSNDAGDGGRVYLLSQGSASLHGKITARGGELSGDGGFVELSGPFIDLQGEVTTFASKGAIGTFLIDPSNITILTTGAPNFSCPYTAVLPSASVTIDNNALETCLEVPNNVMINTASGFAADGDIFVNNDVDYNSTGKLTLMATRDIILADGVKIENSSNAGDMTYDAGRNLELGVNAEIKNSSGSITIEAGQDLILADAINPPPQHTKIDCDANGATLDITVGRDIILGVEAELTANGADLKFFAGNDIRLAANAEVAVFSANLTGEVGRDILITSNTQQDMSFSTNGNPGNLLLIAGRHLESMGAAFIETTTGDLTIVVDNDFPTRPGAGLGHVILGPGSRIENSSQQQSDLKIFTSCHDLNDFSQTEINMQMDFSQPFEAAGTPFVDTSIEHWDTWYLENTAGLGDPYTVFYKCAGGNGGNGGNGNGSTFDIIGGLDAPFGGVTPFRRGFNLLSYPTSYLDECCDYYTPPIFVGYNTCAYKNTARKDSSLLASWEVVPDQCYYMLHRGYIPYNVNGPIEWYQQTPWCCFQICEE